MCLNPIASGSTLRANLMLRAAQVVAALDAEAASAADKSADGDGAADKEPNHASVEDRVDEEAGTARRIHARGHQRGPAVDLDGCIIADGYLKRFLNAAPARRPAARRARVEGSGTPWM